MLIDAHAIIHRAYHAYPPTLKSPSGLQINAVYGFTNILIDVLSNFKPKYVVCAFDSKGPTQRHEMFVDYKANRSAPEDEFIAQLPVIDQVVEAFNIPIFRISGFEADDILGTIDHQAKKEDVEIIIVTGDHDILQLVDDKTKVFISGSGFSKPKLYDEKAVVEKYGFLPERIVDYKALRGDPSDNIPGVKGIGDKTAKALLGQFGNLDGIFKGAEEIAGKAVKNKIMNGVELAELSRKLATIIKDVPLTFKLEDALLTDFETEKVLGLFKELGFRTLVNKIPKLDASKTKEVEESQKINFESVLVDGEGEFAKMIEDLANSPLVAYDTETTGVSSISSKVVGMSFCVDEKRAYYLNLNCDWFEETHVEELRKIFEDGSKKWIGHNLKFDAHMILNNTVRDIPLNISLSNYFFDTMLAAYLLKGGERGVGLKTLSYEKFGYSMAELTEVWATAPDYKAKKKYKPEEIENYMTNCDLDMLAKYAAADAYFTYKLYGHLDKELEDIPELKKLAYEMEFPLIPILTNMEREGVSLDVNYLENFGSEIDKRIKTLEKDIFESVGHEFNVASPKQVGEVLFDELGLPGGKKTKTGAWQTNERVLLGLKGVHEIVDKLLEHRELSKLRSAFVTSLIGEVNEQTRKVHTSYNQAITTTGRLSSSNPNLQNIPVASEDGRKIRKAFVPANGRTFMSFDVSQQELRILAHVSSEPKLIDAYKHDQDVHRLTAAQVFGVEYEKVTPEQRAKGKTLNFSLIYGITAFGLADRMKIPREEAQDLIFNYFQAYKNIDVYFKGLLAEAKASNKVETIMGRYRDTSGLSSQNGIIRNATQREVINFPIQGTAADMIKIAMIKVDKFLNTSKLAKELDAKMILQVHDEVIIELEKANEEKLEEFAKKIEELMAHTIELAVPVKIGHSIGKNWGELK